MNTVTHSKYAMSVMGLECDKVRGYAVKPIGCYRFHVKDGGLDDIVNLNMRGCSYNQFQCLQISCWHVIAAARERNINAFTFCSRFYSAESLVLAYAEAISLLGHILQWKKPMGYVEVKILPPRKVVQVGL